MRDANLPVKLINNNSSLAHVPVPPLVGAHLDVRVSACFVPRPVRLPRASRTPEHLSKYNLARKWLGKQGMAPEDVVGVSMYCDQHQ